MPTDNDRTLDDFFEALSKHEERGGKIAFEPIDIEGWKRLAERLGAMVRDQRAEIDRLRTERDTYFEWAYRLLLVLAREEQQARGMHAGQEWSGLVGSSHSMYLRRARKIAGIPDDEFLSVVRSGEIDVNDLYVAAEESDDRLFLATDKEYLDPHYLCEIIWTVATPGTMPPVGSGPWLVGHPEWVDEYEGTFLYKQLWVDEDRIWTHAPGDGARVAIDGTRYAAMPAEPEGRA